MIFNKKNRTCLVKTDACGFTLLEVIIAMAILAIGILGLTKMQMSSIKGNDTAMEFTRGSTWAADNIETLMGVDYADPGFVDGTDNEGKFTINWTITPSDPVPNVKKITMVVTWNDKGQAKTFTADYYKAITF